MSIGKFYSIFFLHVGKSPNSSEFCIDIEYARAIDRPEPIHPELGHYTVIYKPFLLILEFSYSSVWVYLDLTLTVGAKTSFGRSSYCLNENRGKRTL